ncbi:hypothetical protein ASO20_01165 [Mycoplasma sp. (ex Biomphalaria glabrata)]|uniref:amidase family protein n=1 Tax=Mycoplasma sp. (ex Biomphalaria glabrata) TaxID=1749074 RepID=UPI00073ADA77|nr:amidase family protein [Mycoplasma sp. (ex Biomphalaria glabrata)]ALV23268.1 hypothetical protein ASO20_01165 [Mycoplasma sp. (ex Biomphalaria glabrata)]
MNEKNKTMDSIKKISEDRSHDKAFDKMWSNFEKYEHENLFISFNDKEKIKEKMKSSTPKKSKLWNIVFTAKDNINSADLYTTAGCKILAKYQPLHNATCLDKLLDQGGILFAKNNLDELGMCGTGLSSPFGEVRNPWDKKRISGGSSSGSAAAVALGICQFSLGTDTGDSVRMPASLCGIVGFKPSWNRVSRFGVIPYTPSLDTVGILSRSVEDTAIVYNAIKGYDEKDFTSFDEEKYLLDYSEEYWLGKNLVTNNHEDLLNKHNLKYKKIYKPKKILILKEVYDTLEKFSEHKLIFDSCIEKLKTKGFEFDFLPFGDDLLNALLPAYNILSYAEATSCQAYLQGISLGERINGKNWEEILTNTRSQFTKSIIRRQILGAYFLLEENKSKYFDNAKKFRNLICRKMSELFKKYEIIFLPSTNPAKLIEDVKNAKYDINTLYSHRDNQFLLANFYGSPSISIPIGFIEGMPIGCSINSDQYSEHKCLAFAKILEDCLCDEKNSNGYKNMVVNN